MRFGWTRWEPLKGCKPLGKERGVLEALVEPSNELCRSSKKVWQTLKFRFYELSIGSYDDPNAIMSRCHSVSKILSCFEERKQYSRRNEWSLANACK